jgi:hypothetical protein
VGIVNFHDSFLQAYCVACKKGARATDRVARRVVWYPDLCCQWRSFPTRNRELARDRRWTLPGVSRSTPLVEVGLGDDLFVVEGGQLAVNVCWPRRSC